MTTFRFTEEALDLFSTVSRDTNPLHMSEDYAWRTAFGSRVVFGMLGVLHGLGHIRRAQDLVVDRLTVDFLSPMFMGVNYAIEMDDETADQVTVRISDGGRILVRLTAGFTQVERPRFHEDAAAHSTHRAAPADFNVADFAEPVSVEGLYVPAWDQLEALMQHTGLTERHVSKLQVAVLLWTSYLIGMELPGERALYSKLQLSFNHPAEAALGALNYQARTTRFDSRFNLLRMQAEVLAGQQPFAQAKLAAFVRKDTPAVSHHDLAARLSASGAMQGKVALVIGASRGLGASIAQAFALQGCTVIATYLKSRSAIEQLQQTMNDAAGEIVPLQGSASDVAWCQETLAWISDTYGRLDFLICNACTPPPTLHTDLNAADRINRYLSDNFALVSLPTATFLPLLAQNGGWSVLISSQAVEEPVPDWPHYVSLKYAVEGFYKTTALQYPQASFMIVRPPRLATDMTNTPMGHYEAISPASVAADMVSKISQPEDAESNLALLTDFQPDPAT